MKMIKFSGLHAIAIALLLASGCSKKDNTQMMNDAGQTDGGEIDVWGPGTQTRSFLFVDECIEGTLRLMRSDVEEPVNIGSEEMVSINDLARMVIEISGKTISLKNTPGPIGVMGRNSDNRLLRAHLGWEPQLPLRSGLAMTYRWIEGRLAGR